MEHFENPKMSGQILLYCKVDVALLQNRLCSTAKSISLHCKVTSDKSRK